MNRQAGVTGLPSATGIRLASVEFKACELYRRLV